MVSLMSFPSIMALFIMTLSTQKNRLLYGDVSSSKWQLLISLSSLAKHNCIFFKDVS